MRIGSGHFDFRSRYNTPHYAVKYFFLSLWSSKHLKKKGCSYHLTNLFYNQLSTSIIGHIYLMSNTSVKGKYNGR